MDNLVRVSQLIEGEKDRWNEEMIRYVFENEYAEAILQIPLRRTNNEDTPCWFPNPKGMFSVMNAYRVVITKYIEERIETGSAGYHKYRELESMKALWKYIWHMRIPPKVRVFIWRACRDILSKRTETNLNCYLCHRGEETAQHLIL